MSRSLFRRINGVVVQMLWLEFLFCLQWWAGVKDSKDEGFVSTVKYIRSFVPAVYDVALAVPKNVPPPSFKGMFSKQPSLVKVYIKRYPVEELPKSDEGIAEWCRDRFVANVAIFWIGALLFSIYKLFQTCSPLSSWKGIGITAATLFIVEMLMYVLLLSTQQEQSTPEKQAASPKTSPNKE
ncbi:hypothetical protein RHSIM_Rhsim01G0191300 [Rhododendron simsii]|uniref:1-acylglycerol-3-phosphate O-acyltransferase n=1 Tax=Rhododendron simsii TaxID=118357 RepID=A0A834HRK9_RHOSS|nr:hypothetical protein RHSIM_Rhsim01G0191300 [Rhododendron simsii]